MFIVTAALGVWQLERLHWKLGLLADIDRAEAAPPVPLPANPLPFEKVEVSGQLRADHSAFYGSEVRSTVAGPTLGAQLITPLDRAEGPPILVDRGWLAEHAAVPPSAGTTRIVGYVRPSEPAGWMMPAPDLAAKRFWSLDPGAIGAALGLPQVAPFTVIALGPDGVPDPAHALPRPPNDHLGYAITWFGLSAALLGVFGAYAWKIVRP